MNNQFNLNQLELSEIIYLASEHKLIVNIYKQNNFYSVELNETTRYSMSDKFCMVLADNLTTKKQAQQIATNFINFLDDEKGDIYGNGYNVRISYFDLNTVKYYKAI